MVVASSSTSNGSARVVQQPLPGSSSAMSAVPTTASAGAATAQMTNYGNVAREGNGEVMMYGYVAHGGGSEQPSKSGIEVPARELPEHALARAQAHANTQRGVASYGATGHDMVQEHVLYKDRDMSALKSNLRAPHTAVGSSAAGTGTSANSLAPTHSRSRSNSNSAFSTDSYREFLEAGGASAGASASTSGASSVVSTRPTSRSQSGYSSLAASAQSSRATSPVHHHQHASHVAGTRMANAAALQHASSQSTLLYSEQLAQSHLSFDGMQQKQLAKTDSSDSLPAYDHTHSSTSAAPAPVVAAAPVKARRMSHFTFSEADIMKSFMRAAERDRARAEREAERLRQSTLRMEQEYELKRRQTAAAIAEAREKEELAAYHYAAAQEAYQRADGGVHFEVCSSASDSSGSDSSDYSSDSPRRSLPIPAHFRFSAGDITRSAAKASQRQNIGHWTTFPRSSTAMLTPAQLRTWIQRLVDAQVRERDRKRLQQKELQLRQQQMQQQQEQIELVRLNGASAVNGHSGRHTQHRFLLRRASMPLSSHPYSERSLTERERERQLRASPTDSSSGSRAGATGSPHMHARSARTLHARSSSTVYPGSGAPWNSCVNATQLGGGQPRSSSAVNGGTVAGPTAGAATTVGIKAVTARGTGMPLVNGSSMGSAGAPVPATAIGSSQATRRPAPGAHHARSSSANLNAYNVQQLTPAPASFMLSPVRTYQRSSSARQPQYAQAPVQPLPLPQVPNTSYNSNGVGLSTGAGTGATAGPAEVNGLSTSGMSSSSLLSSGRAGRLLSHSESKSASATTSPVPPTYTMLSSLGLAPPLALDAAWPLATAGSANGYDKSAPVTAAAAAVGPTSSQHLAGAHRVASGALYRDVPSSGYGGRYVPPRTGY